jgi:hypothetical protein
MRVVLLIVLLGEPSGTSALGRCPNLLTSKYATHVGEETMRGKCINGNCESQYKMKALSTSPPVWQVSGFLSSSESESIIAQARKELEHSHTIHSRSVPQLSFVQAYTTLEHAHRQVNNKIPAAFTRKQIKGMFRTMLAMPGMNDTHTDQIMGILDPNKDNKVDKQEFANKASWSELPKLVQHFQDSAPETFARFSQQAWLPGLTTRIARRIATVLGLPEDVVANAVERGGSTNAFGEYAQVVRYQQKGHFTCHHDSRDSKDPDKPDPGKSRRIHRAYTVFIQLRDIPISQGGATWFPGAMREKMTKNWGPNDWNKFERQLQLNHTCSDSEGSFACMMLA